jgi:hypothetical protein
MSWLRLRLRLWCALLRVRQAPSYISAARGGVQHGESSKTEWKHRL